MNPPGHGRIKIVDKNQLYGFKGKHKNIVKKYFSSDFSGHHPPLKNGPEGPTNISPGVDPSICFFAVEDQVRETLLPSLPENCYPNYPICTAMGTDAFVSSIPVSCVRF